MRVGTKQDNWNCEYERPAMGFPETAPETDIVNLLAEASPTAGGVEIDAVRPDLIGEDRKSVV